MNCTGRFGSFTIDESLSISDSTKFALLYVAKRRAKPIVSASGPTARATLRGTAPTRLSPAATASVQEPSCKTLHIDSTDFPGRTPSAGQGRCAVRRQAARGVLRSDHDGTGRDLRAPACVL